MGLSRRQFTKEFKLAAIQRLEMGASLAEVNRAGYYRFVPRPTRPDPDLELRDALQRVALEFPSYGWPRMTANSNAAVGRSITNASTA